MPSENAQLMEQAFLLARSVRGTTFPNPAVGCLVLDRSGKVVAKAATSPTGRPHAERKALESAGRKAEGGTLVVTLEPCVAFPGKKSPPCAAATILSGIETVVVGAQDPNPQVAGRGLHALRKAGMKVLELDLEGTIPDFYAGFGHFLSTGRPRTTLKVAMSADGFVSGAPGARTDITGPEARVFVHGLRAASDAVLVGGSTARVDDPELTVREAPGRSPRRMVLWPRAGLSTSLKLWDGAAPSTAIGDGIRPDTLPKTVEWLRIAAGGEGVDIAAMLDECGRRGMHDLLVEPGPKLLASFLRAGLWDRIWVIRSPKLLGSGVPGDPGRLLPIGPVQRELALGADLATLISRSA
jgi:diaminohydroxyphosphoribosylaminopyrimidine deaminase/5-amino-6-(5-phosphoribosylamino)uracil reductase